MSDHLIAEANRHAMVLPTTQPTHADIAWYVREVSELRAELALLREWQREVIQNANAHHAEREDAIARAERAEAELAADREKVRVLRDACESICEEWGKNHDANPIGAGQRMETMASEMLEDMEEAE